jgi:hypothetical protein
MTIAQAAGKRGGWAVAFLVAAGIVYEIVAACCSSPQTAELNAKARAETLMKWVYIGLAQAAIFVVAAAILDKEHAAPILAGGTLAGGTMYGMYYHALNAGLASSEPGTESYT